MEVQRAQAGAHAGPLGSAEGSGYPGFQGGRPREPQNIRYFDFVEGTGCFVCFGLGLKGGFSEARGLGAETRVSALAKHFFIRQ
jgi:hypothetical protein